ncbi:SMI1/KNR4 family protein [Gimesia sp.]|uniref:SMI1/KNR4 family protein n=1 Tax=Gimesia sp. TaxID=2024833 RepID=UPI003A913FC8
MYEQLIERIKTFTKSKSSEELLLPVSPDVVAQTTKQLGFSLPILLSECYLQLANGGFGPGYGVMGLAGGATSDFGDLLETFQQLKSDHELEGEIWPSGLLPFCEWGGNIFSCVDCHDPRHLVTTFDAGALTPQNYSITEFFELWLNDIDLLDFSLPTTGDVEITNPFTGEKIRISKHKPDDQ